MSSEFGVTDVPPLERWCILDLVHDAIAFSGTIVVKPDNSDYDETFTFDKGRLKQVSIGSDYLCPN